MANRAGISKNKEEQMILLADSGSTKTDWILLSDEGIIGSFRTQGLNPYFVQTDEVISIISEHLCQHIDATILKEIYFYGAGCSSEEKNRVIRDALDRLFPHSSNHVAHDMLAAARALFGDQPGIACILGTGSNSCVYNGQEVVRSLFSLGYMFGDEGSGAHLGKSFIQKYLKQDVPGELKNAFSEKYGLTNEEILTNIYRKANPNRFLASFTHFLKQQETHPYVRSLISNCFDDFFTEQILKYPEYQSLPLGCIGSVAYHFQDVFKAVAKKHGAHANLFVTSPIDGLVRYHSL